jgi:hypothetical protein
MEMHSGCVQVLIPDALLMRAVCWRVRAGSATGQPGERIPVAPGELVVTIEADLTLPGFGASGTLRVPVCVEPGGLTCVHVASALEG